MLRTIGFDRRWARAEGAHLYDADGNRYLDWLGGFGMYNVGRNNPRVRAALVEALELDTPGKLALGVNPLPALLAEELLRRAPTGLGRVLFTSSGTEAVEAAIKIGRAATGRTRVVSVERGFHGLTLGALSASGDAAFSDRFGPLVPGFSRVPFGRPRRPRGGAARARTSRCSSSSRSSATASSCPRRATSRAPRSSAAATGRSSASTRCRPASAAPAGCSRSSTGVSSRTSSPSRSRSSGGYVPVGATLLPAPRCSTQSSTRWSTR